ncbi:MAG: AAA family ATPase [Candidatus Poribacteria bacterium]
MRIRDIYIDGFGVYHNQTVNDIPDGIILFIGKNEGGKTTLMEFIRSTLFGFPSSKDRNNYPPLRGGSHGGRIKLVTRDGQIISVQRFGRKAIISYEDGTSEQAELSEKLFNIDRWTFEKVFAIGLGDLQGLGILSEDSIKGRILAASAGIGAKSIPNIMNDIKSELNDLLKSGRATNPKINQIVRDLSKIRSEIRDLQKNSESYGELQKKLVEFDEKIKENQKNQSVMRQRIERIKLIEQARKSWLELIETEKKLNELEFASGFPPKGLERFEKLKENIDNARLERDDFYAKAQRLEAQLQSIVVDEKVISKRVSIESLIKERQMLISALKDLPDVDRERQQKEDNFREQLKDLGADWDSKRLAEVDTSVQVRHRVQDFDRNIESAERKYEQARINLQSRQNDEKSAKTLLDEAQKDLDSFEKPAIIEKDEIRRQKEIIQQIRSSFHQKDNLDIQLAAKRESFQREDNYIKSLEDQYSQLLQMPLWILIVAILIAFILIGLSIAMKSYVSTAFIFLFFVVVIFGLNILRDHQIKSKKGFVKEIQNHKDIANQISEEIIVIETKIKEKTDEIKEFAHSISLENLNDVSKIDEFERNLNQIDEALRNWDICKEKKEEAGRKYQIAVKNLEEAIQLVESAETELQRLEEEWGQWITERGFDASIRPKGFDTILQMVENARDTENALKGLMDRVKRINDYIAKIREEIINILRSCNMSQRSSEVGISEIDALDTALKTAIENQRKQTDLKEKLDDARREIKNLDKKITNWQDELDELMKKVQAKDEDEFRHIAKSYDNWLKCRDKYDINRQNLINLAGNEEALKSLESDLMETDSFSLLSEKEELERNINNISEQIEKDTDERGKLRERVEQILKDEELSKLLFKQKSLEEQLSIAVKRWATFIVLQSLINQISEKYERERQPKVIKEASEYIKIITDKNYRLMKPIGENSVKIENVDTMERKDEIGWSGGLADQVYLAVRFGLAKDFSEHSEPLPIILDDVLVRFDDERQLGTAKVILNVAKNHQIFIFSCHPLTREIIENAYIETGLSGTVPLTHYIIDDGTIIKV